MAKLHACEIDRSEFGGDKRAINRHSARTYLLSDGRLVELDLTTDMVPPEFSINGPVSLEHVGLVPRLNVGDGAEYFGPNWTWEQAVERMTVLLGIDEILPTRLFLAKHGLFTGFAARKPLPLVRQRQVAKRATAGRETATCPLG